MTDMTGQRVGLVLGGISVEEARKGLVVIKRTRCNKVVCEECDWTKCLLPMGHGEEHKFSD